LVIANLAVLPVVLVFLPLELVTDQCARAQSEAAADSRTGGRMADRRSDNTTDGGSAQRADAGALFPSGQRTTGAAAEQ